jgi:hypothetical protein
MKLIYFAEQYLFLNINPELDTFHCSEEVQFFVLEWFWEYKGFGNAKVLGMQRPDY